MSEHMNFEDEDFIIRIRPSVEENGEWTGEIDISIIAGPDNPLDDESYSQVMHFVRMMCATVPIMEQSKELRDMVHDYVMKDLDRERYKNRMMSLLSWLNMKMVM